MALSISVRILQRGGRFGGRRRLFLWCCCCAEVVLISIRLFLIVWRDFASTASFLVRSADALHSQSAGKSDTAGRLRWLRIDGTATQDWCAAGGHASQSVSSPRLLSVSWQRRWSAAWRTGRPQSLARRCAEKPRPCWGLGFFAASMVVTSIRLLFGVSPVIWRSHTASVRVSWEGVWRRWRRQLCSHRDRLRLPRGATACFHVEIPRRASRATACFRQDTATAHCDVAGRID